MTKSISNENFLESKKQVSFSPIEFEENIITEPSVPINGNINKLNNEAVINNETAVNNETDNETDNITDNKENIGKMVNNSIEKEMNNSNNKVTNNDSNQMVDAETEKEALYLSPSDNESNTVSFATELIDKEARTPKNRISDLNKQEINKLKNMTPGQRANLQVRNEIMQIFPLSVIIALIIFILLLIYVVGFTA